MLRHADCCARVVHLGPSPDLHGGYAMPEWLLSALAAAAALTLYRVIRAGVVWLGEQLKKVGDE